ncbi:hypothetical protein V6Z11_D08G111900 [Gossypium hirsutum]
MQSMFIAAYRNVGLLCSFEHFASQRSFRVSFFTVYLNLILT